ncbi:glycophorin-A isoform X2 [Dromiciops gliroides]|uniref:glycophorin-A isoform X2 n=1 Tax=Dromiciops gliroides TaxID=33562 RepID=UPI001CC6227B|nr:glycophorin-A isoform X2 [Dromiciops gliroides]
MKMYNGVVLLLLFLGYVSTHENSTKEEQLVTTIQSNHNDSLGESSISYGPAIVTQQPARDEAKDFITHPFSGTVVVVIVFSVIAGIVGVILLTSLLVRRLTRKKSFNLKNKDTSTPLKFF